MRATRIYIIVLASFLGSIAGMVALFLVARFSGSETLGVFAYWMSYAMVFGFPMALEMDSAHLRMYAVESNAQTRARYLGTFAILKVLLVTVAIGTVMMGLALDLGRYLQGDSSDDYSVFLIVFASSVSSCLASIPLTTLAADNLTAKQQIATVAGSLSKSLVLAIVGVLALGAFFLGFSYLIGHLVALVIALFFLRRYLISWPRREDIKCYLAIGGPLMFAPVFTALVTSMDKIILGSTWGSSEVGIYFLVQSMALSFLLFGRAIRLVFIPGFTEDLKSGQIDKIEAQSRFVARLVTLISLPSILFLALFSGPWFALLLGDEFEVAGLYLAILLMGIWIYLLSDPLTSIVTAEGRTIVVLKATVAAFAVSLTSLLILVPESIGDVRMFGLAGLGASISFVLACSAQFVVYKISVARIKNYLSLRQLMRTGLSLLCASAASVPLLVWGEQSQIDAVVLFLSPVVFGVIAVVALRMLGEYTKTDSEYLLKVLSPRAMLRYIRDELDR